MSPLSSPKPFAVPRTTISPSGLQPTKAPEPLITPVTVVVPSISPSSSPVPAKSPVVDEVAEISPSKSPILPAIISPALASRYAISVEDRIESYI